MESKQIVGWVLVAVGVLDMVLGLAVVGPRVVNPSARRIVQIALITGAALAILLGVLFLAGAFGA